MNGRGRLVGQAKKLLESRLLQVSKAYAPFVEMAGFYEFGEAESQ